MSRASQLARMAARFGGGRIARGWRRATGAPGRAIVLMYHRVSDEPDYLGMAVAPGVFAKQLDVLRTRTRVVALGELVARLKDAGPLAEDMAAITFDDGYQDNLDQALPLLRRYGLPATVFVSTGFVDGTAHPTGERLRAVCEALWRAKTPASAWTGDAPVDLKVRAALACPGSLETLIQLRQALKTIPATDGERILASLEAMAGGTTASRGLILDWDGVRALADAGIEIGSHAVSHAVLSRLDVGAANDEIHASKQRLEREIGRPVAGFAFPNGRRGDFLPEHLTTLREAGYAYACLAETGSNLPGCDAYQLRRIGVGSDSGEVLDLKLALGRAA